jgi:glycosyltransferase involved in cell wall biosynthesis
MIRIAQIVEAVEGGCKRHVIDLLAGLDPGRFHQVAIVGVRRDGNIRAEIAAATGGKLETVPWDAPREIRPLADWRAYRSLVRFLREHPFDVIHCHSAKAGFLGRLAARGLPARVLYTPHCLPCMMGTSAAARFVYCRLERMAGWYTDRLIAVSPSEGQAAAGLVPPERVVVIENGIDPASVGASVDVARKRAELGLGESSKVVLSVGALRRQKGYRHLIEAVPPAANLCADAVFLIAGEGPLRPELERLVERLNVGERVRLLGRRSDVAELLAIADVFAMPSLWEAGPYALLEAMAAGVPVVGARIPGIIDWVTEGQTGYLVEPANAASLARGLVSALTGPREARRRAEAARGMVLERNTKDRWLRDMAALYESIVSAPG